MQPFPCLDALFEWFFSGIERFCSIIFGLGPPTMSAEGKIIGKLLNEHFEVLALLREPEFEEYGDIYYLINLQWWEAWSASANLSFSHTLFDSSDFYVICH